ncbi:protein of unknown function [Rhodovastum atsumiense]|nr:protein of unknown function [Rhodovastum atsumiense]
MASNSRIRALHEHDAEVQRSSGAVGAGGWRLHVWFGVGKGLFRIPGAGFALCCHAEMSRARRRSVVSGASPW